MFRVLTLNNIAVAGLRRLPRADYEVASEVGHPDAILLRSYKMHDMEVPETVAAIGRAGAGTNNIPVADMTARGVPVFNAPGANANAVKELVIAGMLMAARNIRPALDFAATLTGTDDDISKAVEAGKKQFAGFELPGRTLGVVGLGAIGVEVSNAALALGMKVVGFDPDITVQRAWQLSSGVDQAPSLDHLLGQVDVLTVHVPLVDATRNLINADRIRLLRNGAIIINMARGGIVDEDAVLEAMKEGRLYSYVTDFPSSKTLANPRVVPLPHLGASTAEAEENCAIMVAENVRDYLENGNIRHSVNFPESIMPRADAWRITVANRNVPNMVGQISTALAEADLNIEDLLNKSRGDIAYTVVDLDGEVSEEMLDRLRGIEGVLRVRSLGKPAAA